MSLLERTRSVVIEIDDVINLAGLEEAALAFARSVPGQLVGEAVEAMSETLLDIYLGRRGLPIAAEDQAETPWSCTGCGSRRGFRRRGFRQRDRKLAAACGGVSFRTAQVECLTCARRFAPVLGLLGLRPYQRRTDRLSELAVGLATEVAYAKASSLLAELAGADVSPRSICRDMVAMAPERLGPEVLDVPIVLLDGTGERAGEKKNGVELRFAIGLVARRREHNRVKVEARLLGAVFDEDWAVLGELMADVRPGLLIVDGERELTGMVERTFPGVPIQRCLFHLAHGFTYAAWRGGASQALRKTLFAQLEATLTEAHRDGNPERAKAAYAALIEEADNCGAVTAAIYLREAEAQVFTFLTHPGAGRLLFGHKGRPELASSVLERVMRELNRRTDNGTRWSIEGLRALLMVKLGRKYAHGRWAPEEVFAKEPTVRLRLVA